MGIGESRLRKHFNSLDTNHQNVLHLSQLFNSQILLNVNRPLTKSPSLIFRYDPTRIGGLNFEGFKMLLAQTKEIQQKDLENRDGAYDADEFKRQIDLALVDDDPETPIPMLTTPVVEGSLSEAGAEEGTEKALFLEPRKPPKDDDKSETVEAVMKKEQSRYTR